TAGAWINSAGSSVQAARTLYCHRNTVVNRLARIQRLAGVNLTDARCWSQVALALSALRYQQNRGQNRTGGTASPTGRGGPRGSKRSHSTFDTLPNPHATALVEMLRAEGIEWSGAGEGVTISPPVR